jgi:hypothetical protein
MKGSVEIMPGLFPDTFGIVDLVSTRDHLPSINRQEITHFCANGLIAGPVMTSPDFLKRLP